MHLSVLRLWSCALNDVSRYRVHCRFIGLFKNSSISNILHKVWCCYLWQTMDFPSLPFHFWHLFGQISLQTWRGLSALSAFRMILLSWCIETSGLFYRHLFKCSWGFVYGAFCSSCQRVTNLDFPSGSAQV